MQSYTPRGNNQPIQPGISMGARKGPSVCMKPINNSVTRALVTGKWTTQQFNRGATRGISQVEMVPDRSSSWRRDAGLPAGEAGKAGLCILPGTSKALLCSQPQEGEATLDGGGGGNTCSRRRLMVCRGWFNDQHNGMDLRIRTPQF